MKYVLRDYTGLAVVAAEKRMGALFHVYIWVLEHENLKAEERAGVIHIVHAWIQQNQPDKVCFTDLVHHTLISRP